MIKAVLINGVIVPRDPLPEDWQEGTEVVVEKLKSADPIATPNAADIWMDEVEAIARQGNQEDDERLAMAIQAIRSRKTTYYSSSATPRFRP